MAQQLSVLKDKLVTWFQGLSDSEQQLIKIATPVFVVFVIYSVVSSVHYGVTESTTKLKQQQELNGWAKQQIAIINAAGISTNTGAKSSGSMTQVINSTARKNSITIARIQPQKTDMVKVGLDDIGFNRLVTWLQELQSKHGIRVENIDFAKADEQGKVKVRRLDLARG